jgi:hypothetical protein
MQQQPAITKEYAHLHAHDLVLRDLDLVAHAALQLVHAQPPRAQQQRHALRRTRWARRDRGLRLRPRPVPDPESSPPS